MYAILHTYPKPISNKKAQCRMKLGVFQPPQLAVQFCPTCALQSQFFYAYCVSPGPSYTKTKELIGWEEIVRATIAYKFALAESGRNLFVFPHEPISSRVRCRLWYKRIRFIQISYTQSSANAAFEFVVAFMVVVALSLYEQALTQQKFSLYFNCTAFNWSIA